ncbi:MAG: patatin-like phospholipase family protein [Vicinamibacterales bacterium]
MPSPQAWCEVLEEEFTALHGEPPLPPGAPVDPDERLRLIRQAIHRRPTSGLCFSGGGIRSGTFALGVLQGLAHLGVLGRFDYLSTVSGGGYIGGWFTAWLHRVGPDRRQDTLRALDPARTSAVLGRIDAPPVDYVRRTCRYLAPRGGAVSADLWTVIATLARNLVLNWCVLLPLIAAALLVPRMFYALSHAFEQGFAPYEGLQCLTASPPPMVFLGLAVAGFFGAVGYVAMVFSGRGGRWSQGRFLLWFLTPLLAGAIGATLFWSSFPCDLSLPWSLGLGAALPAAGWLLLGLVTRPFHGQPPAPGAIRPAIGLRTVLAAAASGPILGAGAYWFATHEFGFGAGEPLRDLYAVFSVPIVLVLALATITIFVGFASRDLDDAALEWWSRCAAWIGIATATWLVAGAIVFYMADALEAGLEVVDRALGMERRTSTAVVTSLLPLLSSLAGLAARSTGATDRPSAARLAIQRVALPLVILALLSSIAWVNLRAAEALEYHRDAAGQPCTTATEVGSGECHPAGGGLGEVMLLGSVYVAFGLLMSLFVPVNRFSLHGMYRQRLIRTFLGASRPDRQPNPFTGFDGGDDLRVHDLADVRPLHIINATLNAVSSGSVGRHERQAQSFTFSPLHVGNREVGYRPAAEYGSDGGGPGTGLSLGMALAVSGAAASSAMGMYSSKARSFLLTLANARLGLWFGNPRDAKTWRTSEPPLGVGPILRELLGLTTDRNPWVYLSDGGHYENLGLWEMVARRCRVIVVSDAGCDPDYAFDDLSNAIRRIRLDLGVPIQFPPLRMTKAGQGHGNPHAAIGVIRYGVVDGPDAPDGTLIYLKATLSGDETVDVRNFARSDEAFPHDPTSDQFFDEARFESYRALGFHTVITSAPGCRADDGVEGLCAAVRAALERQAATSGPPPPSSGAASPAPASAP